MRMQQQDSCFISNDHLYGLVSVGAHQYHISKKHLVTPPTQYLEISGRNCQKSPVRLMYLLVCKLNVRMI